MSNQTTAQPFSSVRVELPASVSSKVPLHACQKLLKQSEWRVVPGSSRLIRFAGVEGRDVYNIAAPFEVEGRLVIAGRVENRDCELAQLMFFQQEGETWVPCPEAPVLAGLQDPCVTIVDDELVVGGVHYPVVLDNGQTGWRMEFYRGRSLSELKLFLCGPNNMKDIRLRQLADGRIGILSRPQGGIGGRGRIGFTIAPSLDAITAELIENAPLLERQWPEEEWGGANEAHLLSDGTLGILGHVAWLDEENGKHYYSIVFHLDPASRTPSPIRVIASRQCFLPGPAKRPDLVDVVFTGGLVRHGNGTATLYAGLSDAEAGCVTIQDPFAEYEV